MKSTKHICSVVYRNNNNNRGSWVSLPGQWGADFCFEETIIQNILQRACRSVFPDMNFVAFLYLFRNLAAKDFFISILKIPRNSFDMNQSNMILSNTKFTCFFFFHGRTVKTWTSSMLGSWTEYWKVQPWQAPAWDPFLSTATTAPTKSGNFLAILETASLAASSGFIPCLMLSTTW